MIDGYTDSFVIIRSKSNISQGDLWYDHFNIGRIISIQGNQVTTQWLTGDKKITTDHCSNIINNRINIYRYTTDIKVGDMLYDNLGEFGYLKSILPSGNIEVVVSDELMGGKHITIIDTTKSKLFRIISEVKSDSNFNFSILL